MNNIYTLMLALEGREHLLLPRPTLASFNSFLWSKKSSSFANCRDLGPHWFESNTKVSTGR